MPTSTSRGPALLAFAGSPTPETLAVMVACAANLARDLLAITVDGRRGDGVITAPRELAPVVAAARKTAAAVVVVAPGTPTLIVRRLAAATRRPVLIARTRAPWRTVLAATDLRTRGAPVVAAGAALAASAGAASVVVHSVAPGWIAPGATLARGDRAARAVAARMRRLARVAARTTPPPEVVIASAASPARAIVHAAAEREADVLVVGMRRPTRRGPRRCADRVLTSAAHNVVVVPLGAARTERAGGAR